MANTSWGNVAEWYDEMVGGSDSYQKNIILPNILRLMNIKKGENILDLACGQGLFAGEFSVLGANVTASDISKELIDLAKKNPKSKDVKFVVSPADNLKFAEDKSIDKIALVLAIQNIGNVNGVFKECGRVLKDGGKLFIVLNHPAFRIPKESSWGYDESKGIQYRRMDSYLSESKTDIDMTPGSKKDKKFTVSFHRPLQLYFKSLKNSGFCVSNIEEWISDKESQKGPRKKAEDRARKEFPLFLMLECIKNKITN